MAPRRAAAWSDMAATVAPVPTLAERRARWPQVLLALYVVIWTLLAVDPWYRREWLIENVLVVVVVALLVATYRRMRFSNGAYTALFVYLVFCAIGAHYTYARVPYDQWMASVSGTTLNALLGFERNHFDRVVHFLFGAMTTPAIAELLAAQSPLRGVWRWLVPVCIVGCAAMVFELLEWLAVVLWGGGMGMAYLGIQGDVWDPHADMALATLGSALTMTWLVPRARHRRP